MTGIFSKGFKMWTLVVAVVTVIAIISFALMSEPVGKTIEEDVVYSDEKIADYIAEQLDREEKVVIIDRLNLEGRVLISFYLKTDTSEPYEYGYLELGEKKGKYLLWGTHDMIDHGEGLRSAIYKNAYLFVVNNPDCSSIEIVHNEKDAAMDRDSIKVDGIPSMYFYSAGDIDFSFLDRNGKQLQSLKGPYYFPGETEVISDDRSFFLEDLPKSEAEEIVVLDFLYTITADFDSKYNILADIEPHKISIENQKKQFDRGVYTKNITVHQISTLSEKEYGDRDNTLLYYYGWDIRIKEHGLSSYDIVNVIYSVSLTKKALDLGPQWGEGTWCRSFIVGRTSNSDYYRIYDFGVPLYVEPPM
ncbi:MAG TPA: hypothetical protein VFC96_04555 [Anaerovoracaceae bacterium]|nr:hypothetical protein [Anaerovoracaceae bacterium]